jgi:hypothetical protein
MEAFSNTESLEQFKHRLNSLTEKLNKTDKNRGQESNGTGTVA